MKLWRKSTRMMMSKLGGGERRLKDVGKDRPGEVDVIIEKMPSALHSLFFIGCIVDFMKVMPFIDKDGVANCSSCNFLSKFICHFPFFPIPQLRFFIRFIPQNPLNNYNRPTDRFRNQRALFSHPRTAAAGSTDPIALVKNRPCPLNKIRRQIVFCRLLGVMASRPPYHHRRPAP